MADLGLSQVCESLKISATFSDPIVSHTCRGKAVVVVGQGSTIGVWDRASAAPLEKLLGHSGDIRELAADTVDDRRLVASGATDSTARVWDIESGELVVTFAGHGGAVTTVAFGRLTDGAIVATGDADGAVRLWDLASGERISHCMTDHASWISAVRCAADGPHLLCATGSTDGVVRVWSITEERLLAEISLATAVADLALTADRRLFVATGSGLATFQIHR